MVKIRLLSLLHLVERDDKLNEKEGKIQASQQLAPNLELFIPNAPVRYLMYCFQNSRRNKFNHLQGYYIIIKIQGKVEQKIIYCFKLKKYH